MTDSPIPERQPLSPALAGLATAALAALALVGVPTLLWLSSFGQNPLPTLPLAAIVFLGGVFVAPVASLVRRLTARSAVAVLAIAGLVALALAWLLPSWTTLALTPAALLAPATTLGLSAVFRLALPRERGAMLAAMTVYIACTLLANYTFDAFIPLSEIAGFAFPLNVGTLFFGITFTQRDRVHRFGRRAVYAMIGTAAVLNVVTALSLGTPLRYVAVSFLAILISETADTEVYQRMLHRGWWTRVASSNAVSAPLDTVLFTVLAFAGEPFATPVWMLEVAVTDILVKYASSRVAALGIQPPRLRAPA